MRSTVEIDLKDAEKIEEIVSLSLESGEKVNYSLDSEDESLEVNVEAESLGVLRGCTDTVFRLTTLAKKIY